MEQSPVPLVLVVDDDSLIRDVVSDVLVNDGYEVLCAKDGIEALRWLKAGHRPALVVLDLMMPVMNGWELLAALRADEELASIPTLVASASRRDMPTHHRGPFRFLLKPFSYDVLMATVQELISYRSSPKEEPQRQANEPESA